MTLPPPLLEADPLGAAPVRPDNGQPAEDPILGAYEARAQVAGAPTDAPGLPLGPDEVTAFVVAVGDVLARVRGEHWRIEPDEVALMAPAIARQASKPDTAFGAWLAAHADGVLIALGSAAIVIPRAVIEYQVIRWRRAQLRAAASQEAYPGGYGPVPQPLYTQPGPAGETPPAGVVGPAESPPGEGLPADGGAAGAVGRPTDPGDLAASLGALTGR